MNLDVASRSSCFLPPTEPIIARFRVFRGDWWKRCDSYREEAKFLLELKIYGVRQWRLFWLVCVTFKEKSANKT